MTNFKTRKKDGQVYPTDKKTSRDSGNPSYVGVDKSQIEYEPKSMSQFTKGNGFVKELNERDTGLPPRMIILSGENRRKMRNNFVDRISPTKVKKKHTSVFDETFNEK